MGLKRHYLRWTRAAARTNAAAKKTPISTTAEHTVTILDRMYTSAANEYKYFHRPAPARSFSYPTKQVHKLQKNLPKMTVSMA